MKTIKLDRWNISQYDDPSPFILESGELELQFTLPDTNGEYFVVDGKNKIRIADGKASIPVTEGVLSLSVKRYIDGKFTEAFAIEPLEVVSVDGSVTVFPQISVLQTAVKDIYGKYRSAMQSFLVTKEEAERWRKQSEGAAHQLALAFFSYAYTDYKNNVYLNSKDLSAREFAEVFGYSEEFTDEEFDTMNKEKEL